MATYKDCDAIIERLKHHCKVVVDGSRIDGDARAWYEMAYRHCIDIIETFTIEKSNCLMTNGDKLRSMDNEELAEALSKVQHNRHYDMPWRDWLEACYREG